MKEFRCYGPPGTGKTHWLATQVERAAEKYAPEEIFVCSFTKAAAYEIANRVKKGLVDEKNVGTIHALCYRALKRPHIAELNIKDWNEKYGHIWPIKKEGENSLDEPEVDIKAEYTILNEYNLYRGRLEENRMPPDVKRFAVHWEQWKKQNYLIDFTDMLVKAPRYMPNMKVLLVDETQDCTPLQFKVLHEWGFFTKMFVVCGDDDQLIYGFAGARPGEMLSPLPEGMTKVLSQSYRVPRAVHAFSDKWIKKLGNRRFPKEYHPRDADGEIVKSPISMNETDVLIMEIRKDLAAGKKVMVLTTCGYMLETFIAQLREAGMVFGNPYRRTRGDWNPLGRKETKGRVVSFWELHQAMNGTNPEYLDDPLLWIDLVEMIRTKDNLKHKTKKILKDWDGERELLWHDLTEEKLRLAVLEGNFEWLRKNVIKQYERQIGYITDVVLKHDIGILDKDPGLVVGTIHSVKGGEADVVYIFPDISKAAAIECETSGRPAIDSLIRTFYVGFTRAREKLVIGSPSGKIYMDIF